MSNLIANHKILVKRLITKLPIMNTITSMKIVEKVFLCPIQTPHFFLVPKIS